MMLRSSALLTLATTLLACGATTGFRTEGDGGSPVSPSGMFPYSRYVLERSTGSFESACTLPGANRVMVGSDDSSTSFAMPINFRYYASTISNVWVSTNGVLGLDGAMNSNFGNTSLPTTSIPDPAIFAFWDDLFATNGVCFGARNPRSGSGQFLVTWEGNTFCCDPNNPERYTVTIRLTEGTDLIEVMYRLFSSSTRTRGSSATIGVQARETGPATQASFDQATITDGLLLRFIPSN